MSDITRAAQRRKARARVESTGLAIPRISSPPIEVAAQLTVGGKLVHRLTHRCSSYCNQVADLAGLGRETA